MLSNKNFNPIVTGLFRSNGNLDTLLAFITQLDFAVPKNIRLNSKHYFIMKIPSQ